MAERLHDDPPSLSPSQRQKLKAMAHSMQPIVQLGAAGLSASVVAQLDEALERHELIKTKLGKSFEGDRAMLEERMGASVGAAVIQSIGRVIVLYRPRKKDLRGKPRIKV